MSGLLHFCSNLYKNLPWTLINCFKMSLTKFQSFRTPFSVVNLKDTFLSTLQIICLFSLLCWSSTAVSFRIDLPSPYQLHDCYAGLLLFHSSLVDTVAKDNRRTSSELTLIWSARNTADRHTEVEGNRHELRNHFMKDEWA